MLINAVTGVSSMKQVDRIESETPEVDVSTHTAALGRASYKLEELAIALSLAQTQIKGHMRVQDELKAEIAGLEQGTVFCDGCAFRYGAEHKLADGTYSCPVCELAQAQARIAELEKDAARYRWLVGRLFERSLHFRGLGNAIQLCDANGNVLGSAAGADAAIDEAMKNA
jgi:hypothetical protein